LRDLAARAAALLCCSPHGITLYFYESSYPSRPRRAWYQQTTFAAASLLPCEARSGNKCAAALCHCHAAASACPAIPTIAKHRLQLTPVPCLGAASVAVLTATLLRRIRRPGPRCIGSGAAQHAGLLAGAAGERDGGGTRAAGQQPATKPEQVRYRRMRGCALSVRAWRGLQQAASVTASVWESFRWGMGAGPRIVSKARGAARKQSSRERSSRARGPTATSTRVIPSVGCSQEAV